MVYLIIASIFLLQYNIPPFYINYFPVFPDLLLCFIIFMSFKQSRIKILLITFLLSLIQDFQINYDMIGLITFSNLISAHILCSILLVKNDTSGNFLLYMVVLFVILVKYIIFHSILSLGNDFSLLMIASAIGIQSFIIIFIIIIINEMILPNKIIK